MLNSHNPQHLNLRRMLAGITARHAAALADNGWQAAQQYRHMAAGMQRVCLHVLKDAAAFAFCCQVHDHLLSMECVARREVVA